MRNALAVAVSSLFVAAFCSSVAAQQLPKSGSISVHSGYWAVGESVNVGEKAVQGHGHSSMPMQWANGSRRTDSQHIGKCECSDVFFNHLEGGFNDCETVEAAQ